MVKHPSLVPPPAAFELLKTELLTPEYMERVIDSHVFRAILKCSCGKTPYVSVVVDDPAVIETKAFWADFWMQMYWHEKAECATEGREFIPDLEWEKANALHQTGRPAAA